MTYLVSIYKYLQFQHVIKHHSLVPVHESWQKICAHLLFGHMSVCDCGHMSSVHPRIISVS
jgi:hypothetical protein